MMKIEKLFLLSRAINSIQKFIDQAYKRIKNNGRLFYIGSGTPGRLGIVDASECLPTFGVSNLIIGIIAGGDSAIRNSKEGAEDDIDRGCWIYVNMIFQSLIVY